MILSDSKTETQELINQENILENLDKIIFFIIGQKIGILKTYSSKIYAHVGVLLQKKKNTYKTIRKININTQLFERNSETAMRFFVESGKVSLSQKTSTSFGTTIVIIT